MLIRLFTLTLEPADPIQFSIAELRSFFAGKLGEYQDLHKNDTTGVIHRYPVVQCKQLKSTLTVLGIAQGAALLEGLSSGRTEISSGTTTCTILSRDAAQRNEEFGISRKTHTYEFLTPWLALNQQNARKFYELKGKPERDAFMKKILSGNLSVLSKSLDYKIPEPITCEARIKFRIDWIERESVMVFLGKFQTNLRVPDYFGIGQSVSSGFGTLKSLPDITGDADEVNSG